MSDHPPAPRLTALQLTVSIALGLWLGFLAIVLTGWLLSRFLFNEQLAPVAAAVQQLGQPPAVQPAPQPPTPMFEKYQQNLQRNEQRQALDQARSDPRKIGRASCRERVCQYV